MQFKQNKIKPNKNDNPLLPDTLREEFSLARYQRNPVTQELQHEIDTIQPGRVDRIYLAMSNQLSAFCGCISGFLDICPWQQTAGQVEKMNITCILQQVHFVGEKMMRDSFQCLTKQMTWRLLHETLQNQNNDIRLKNYQRFRATGKLEIHFLSLFT